ncbi:hypothetical protein TH63_10325 [Rufibacter radiotolerans]|uniref:Uncharacterized protein n=1 Tax=Rufibacter radiotolerans TaxID=1379910 RepID=A0A0H4VJF6_9BACT|nr:hypothetical protein [Rufibacter radiotolerans]AKQ45950.1 hypothetical protein TH63_10325 [Rufibacter radiotolerans]
MSEKENGKEKLRLLLEEFNLLQEDEKVSMPVLLQKVESVLQVLRSLGTDGYTEDQTHHIVNYCKLKMKYARKQIENGDVEEGLQFAKSVISYYLKEASAPETTLEN